MRDNYATEPHNKREVIDVPIHNRRPAIDRLQEVVLLQGWSFFVCWFYPRLPTRHAVLS